MPPLWAVFCYNRNMFSRKYERETFKSSKEKKFYYSITRQQVLKRDGHKCTECNKDNVILHVHHIKKIKDGGTNTIDNLITLCYKCHSKIHVKKLRPISEIRSKMPNRFLYIPLFRPID